MHQSTMSPRRDRMKGHKRDHGYHSRHENGSDNHNQRPPHGPNEVWTEHMSSSGKKYYYNSLCGISQWEKPHDWIDPSHPRRPAYPHPGRESEADSSDHYPRRFRENASHHHESNYRDHHHHHNNYHHQHHSSDFRGPRNSSHYNYPEVHPAHVVHETDNSSGGSTPVQDASRLRSAVHDSHIPHTMASALPRNLSHQSSMHHPAAANNYPPNENMNRHTSLNMLRNSKPDGMQNVGAYGNFVSSDTPMLTPSLSKHVSNDLVKHVANWPADVLERQAHKFSDESYVLGNLQNMRVCTELKCARAVVRHMEIKATLQDQKMLYIRQQIEAIDKVKSHNAITSDDVI